MVKAALTYRFGEDTGPFLYKDTLGFISD